MATAQKKKKKTKESAPAASRGLDARRLATAAPPTAVETLSRTIVDDGGSVLAVYRDPLGGHWQMLAGLPIDRVEPTPYQRDLSEAHVGRVANAIDKLDRYLDPVIAVPAGDGKYWSPNGYHRLGAMRELGAKSIVALVVPEPEVAHRILLLNTEKAHNLRERALEVSRLAEALVGARRSARARVCDRVRGGGARHARSLLPAERSLLGRSVSSRSSSAATNSSASKLPTALAARRLRAEKLLELNELVNEAVKSMKSRGLESPYLKAFVVARINPLRFQRKPTADFDETIDKMLAQRAPLRFHEGQGRPGGAQRRRAVDGGMTGMLERSRVPLFNGPTAVEEMSRLRAELGAAPKLLIKRDDAIPFGFGGNKVRKLEYALAQALAFQAPTRSSRSAVCSRTTREPRRRPRQSSG